MRLPDPARSYAILVGTGTYDAAELGDLPSVGNNLRDLRDVLTDPLLGGLPPDHCVVIEDPADDLTVVDEVLRHARLAGDTLIVYLAGHGIAGRKTGELYLALKGTDPDQVPFRTLRYDDLRGIVMDRGRFPAANRIVILDCCFAGRAIPAMSAEEITGIAGIEGVYILAAAAGNQIALAPPGARNTAFTEILLSLLRTGIPGGPEFLTLTMVHDQILRAMMAKQLPLPRQINRDTVSRLAISRNAAYASRSVPAGHRARTGPAKPVIKTVGIGGGGVNAVNRMIEIGLIGVEWIAVNTDSQALLMSDATVKLDIGGDLAVRGLGAGARPEVGRWCADAHRTEIEQLLRGADLVFVTCGMGGGTGTGGAPVVADVARRIGALTVAVVTRPFSFEGRRRLVQAEAGIDELRKYCDTMIVIPNDRLLALGDRGVGMGDAFRMADDVLLGAVQCLTQLITSPGLIRIDYGTIRAALTNAGEAFIGFGRAAGRERVALAIRAALANQHSLVDTGVRSARTVLVSVAGNASIAYEEVAAGMAMVEADAHPDAQLVVGVTLDNALGDEVQVAIVATGAEPFDPAGRT